MSFDFTSLFMFGYQVIPNVLGESEIGIAHYLYNEWVNSFPDEYKMPTNGLVKHFQNGHTAFNWYVRTRNGVLDVFKNYWNTNNIACSYEPGCRLLCSNDTVTRYSSWQISRKKYCEDSFIRGIVNFSDVSNSGLEVIPFSHLEFHETKSYLRDYHLLKDHRGGKRESSIVRAPAGSMILFDSRLVHRYIRKSESRLWQWVSFIPRDRICDEQLVKRSQLFEAKKITWEDPYYMEECTSRSGRCRTRINYDWSNSLENLNLNIWVNNSDIYKIC